MFEVAVVTGTIVLSELLPLVLFSKHRAIHPYQATFSSTEPNPFVAVTFSQDMFTCCPPHRSLLLFPMQSDVAPSHELYAAHLSARSHYWLSHITAHLYYILSRQLNSLDNMWRNGLKSPHQFSLSLEHCYNSPSQRFHDKMCNIL